MEKQEEEGVAQVVETVGGGDDSEAAVLDVKNGNKERGFVEGKNEQAVSDSIQENRIDGGSVEVQIEIETEATGVTESVTVGDLLDGNAKPDVQVIDVNAVEDEEREIVRVNGDHSCGTDDSLEVDKLGNVEKVTETFRVDEHTVVENVNEGIRVTIDSSSVEITESVVEQVQVVEGSEVAMIICEELFETREVVSTPNASDEENPSSLDNNGSVGAQAVGGVGSESDMGVVDGDLASDVLMTEENGSVEGRNTGTEIGEGGDSTVQTEIHIEKTQVVGGDEDIEAQTACGPTESTANGDLCQGDEISTQDGQQDTVALVEDQVSHQVDEAEKMNPCPANENLDDGIHATEEPSALPDGSKHTDSGDVIENHVLGDGTLPDVSQENGAEISETEGDMDFSVLVLDEEQTNDNMDVDNFEGHNTEIGYDFAGSEQTKNMEQQVVKTDALKPEPTARYELMPGKEGEFSVSDLVWGKVRSHPWWPGQIFDPSDASELAMKYYKKDSFLVAYFGDQSFAWNEPSAMKSFCAHFSQMERQNSTEAFRIAIDGALDEIHRRVEFGMACSSMPENIRDKVKYQSTKNPGIREEARSRDGLDKNLSGVSFQPIQFVRYIKELALNPCGGGDRLELVIAHAQLRAFYRSKGISCLPENHVFENGLLEYDDFDVIAEERERDEKLVKVEQRIRQSQSRKRKHNPDDNAHHHNRKEKSLSDLMTTKRPEIDVHNHADVDSTAQLSSPQSFKIGECLRRVASQLTGGPPILKSGAENLPDMLSKLRLAARDHKKGHSVLTVIGGFFSEFRNSSILNYASLKPRKKSEHMVGSAEPFDFEDTNDSYWTDRIVQNASDEQAAEKNSEGKEETDLEANRAQKDNVSQAPGRLIVTKVILAGGEKELTLSTRKNRKRKEHSDQETPRRRSGPGPSTKKPSTSRSRKKKEPPLAATGNNENQLNDVQEKKGPTALLLKFTKPYPVPPATKLNNIFRSFGPLKESETVVVKDTNSAIVVFKTYSDAEVALSSAGKFSIFGPAVVSYELSCFPLPPPICDATRGSDFLTLLEEAPLCNTTQGTDSVEVLEEAPLCSTTQGSHDGKLSEEAPLCNTTQGSLDVKLLEEASLCDTTQGGLDVKLLEESTT